MSNQELLARVAWNYLVEPGDRVAGLLIGSMGPEAAMAKVDAAAAKQFEADRAAEASAQLFAGVPFCVCPACRGDGCADCNIPDLRG